MLLSSLRKASGLDFLLISFKLSSHCYMLIGNCFSERAYSNLTNAMLLGPDSYRAVICEQATEIHSNLSNYTLTGLMQVQAHCKPR